MDETEQFVSGDRVRIDPSYWDEMLAGRTGTVAAYPHGATPQPGAVWIELDVTEWKPGITDGAEVDADSLRRL